MPGLADALVAKQNAPTTAITATSLDTRINLAPYRIRPMRVTPGADECGYVLERAAYPLVVLLEDRQPWSYVALGPHGVSASAHTAAQPYRQAEGGRSEACRAIGNGVATQAPQTPQNRDFCPEPGSP